MPLCISCGLRTPDGAELCPHHHGVSGGAWAVGNRIMCDFFHRHRVPRRLNKGERDDEHTAITQNLDDDGSILIQITQASGA